MNHFSLSRMGHLLRIDALRVTRQLIFGAVILQGLVILFYLSSFDKGHVTNPSMGTVMFGIYLLAGGLLLTGASFQDMHHPLERYHYLMLPCSNLERFFSRYLVTGPLYLLYVALTFSAIDWVGNQLAQYWLGTHEPLFSVFAERPLALAGIYLSLHVLLLTGAICFRSHALIRTAVALMALVISLLVTLYLSLRIFYWSSFSWVAFNPNGTLHLPIGPIFAASWLNTAVVIAFLLWMLYVAYRCLRVHEVQDGI